MNVFALSLVALAQIIPTTAPLQTPTTPPFVPSPTPSNPESAFESVYARFEASTLTPLTGEPFTLSLVVTLPEGAFIAEWPLITGTWGAFEIRASGEIVKVEGDMRQDFTAALWRPEDAVTPDTLLGYSAGGSDVRRIPVRALLISVPTVLHPDDETLKPPIPPIFTVWPYPALILALGAAGAAGVALWSRRPVPEPLPPPTAAQLALTKLKSASKRTGDAHFQRILGIVRDLNAAMPHDSLLAVIAAGEALAYTGSPVNADDAAAFYELAVCAVREAASA